MWLLFGDRMSEFGRDSAHAYWNVWRVGLYTRPPGSVDAFNYSPAFAQLIYPLTLLPWPAFAAVWSVLMLACLAWLLWPLRSRWRWLALAYVAPQAVYTGNIEVFMALAAVVGMRRPGAWAVPLLTKITPGLGPVWFAVRREWRKLGTAIVTTAAVCALSFVVAPDLWTRWAQFLLASPTPATQDHYLPLAVRLPAALAIVAWGAWKGRPEALAIGMLLAVPLWSAGTVFLLAAIPRLSQESRTPQVPSAAGGGVRGWRPRTAGRRPATR